MKQLAKMIGGSVNNPKVAAEGCAMMGDLSSLSNIQSEAVGFGNVWSPVFTISGSSGDDVVFSNDWLIMTPNTNKSEWWDPVMVAIGTFDGWEVPTVATDALTTDGIKPIYNIKYNGPSNQWINIHRVTPTGDVDDIKITATPSGLVTVVGTDQYGPFGTPPQVPC